MDLKQKVTNETLGPTPAQARSSYIEAGYADCGFTGTAVEQIGHVVIDEHTRIAQFTHAVPLGAHS